MISSFLQNLLFNDVHLKFFFFFNVRTYFLYLNLLFHDKLAEHLLVLDLLSSPRTCRLGVRLGVCDARHHQMIVRVAEMLRFFHISLVCCNGVLVLFHDLLLVNIHGCIWGISTSLSAPTCRESSCTCIWDGCTKTVSELVSEFLNDGLMHFRRFDPQIRFKSNIWDNKVDKHLKAHVVPVLHTQISTLSISILTSFGFTAYSMMNVWSS